MSGDLWEHQERALAAATSQRRLLIAHACGAGKTRTALEFLAAETAPGMLSLIVAPLGAHDSAWWRELRKLGLAERCTAVRSAGAPRPAGADFVLTTLETLRRALLSGWRQDAPVLVEDTPGCLRRRLAHRRAEGHWLLDGPYAAVVIDEAHEVRQPRAGRAVAARIACANASAALGLSGTPVNRHPQELRAILQTLGVSDLTEPAAHVHQQAPLGARAAEPEALHALYSLADLTPAAARLYNAQLVSARQELEEATSASCARVHRCLQRLELAAAHPALLERSIAGRAYSEADAARIAAEGSPALRRLEALLAELQRGGHRLLVVSAPQTHLLRAARSYLEPRAAVAWFWYAGFQTPPEREAARLAFVGSTRPAVLLLSQKAGGQSLSLVPATALIFMSVWYTHFYAICLLVCERCAHDYGSVARIFACIACAFLLHPGTHTRPTTRQLRGSAAQGSRRRCRWPTSPRVEGSWRPSSGCSGRTARAREPSCGARPPRRARAAASCWPPARWPQGDAQRTPATMTPAQRAQMAAAAAPPTAAPACTPSADARGRTEASQTPTKAMAAR